MGADGRPQGETWKIAARWNADARRALQGPAFPEEVRYLWTWAIEMLGRSGASLSGPAPLTIATVREYAGAFRGGEMPTGREILALMRIDTALRGMSHDDPAKVDPSTDPSSPSFIPWPERPSTA